MSFVDELKKIPPVTRIICGSSLAVTIPFILGMVSPYKLLYVSPFVWKKWEFWRLYTSFFLGSPGLNYLFEFFMLYRYSDQLESSRYAHRSHDYAWQVLLACASLVALNEPLNTYVFTRAFTLTIIYIYASLSPPGAQSSLFGLVSFPVAYLPYVTLGVDVINGGAPAFKTGATGLLVGHLWWWGIWGGDRASAAGRGGDREGAEGVLGAFGRAPSFFKILVGHGNDGEPPAPGPVAPPPDADEVLEGVTVVAPRRLISEAAAARAAREAARGSTRGSGSSTRAPGADAAESPEYRWGPGHRLGS